MRLIATTLGIWLVAAASIAPAAAQVELRVSKIQSYMPVFPQKKAMNRAYRDTLKELRQEMLRRQVAGENVACSGQIVQETHWLINYTTRRADIERRLQDLRDSLAASDQSFASRQDTRDGSFGPCFKSWIWRFNAIVDPLKDLAARGEKPTVPLRVWDSVDTPEKITALMEGLLISDIAEGYNKRKELNMAVTALGQLLWLDSTASVFPDHLDRQRLGDALKAFVDARWQDPETGYWGSWYRDKGEIRKTNDLSQTFHIISYRGGDVRWPKKIAQTTFSIRHVPYPYGWDSGGMQNNHHAYDVARIVNLTWQDLDPTQQSISKALLLLLTARSLGLSIDGDGAFDPEPYSTVGEAYYFGLSFFAEIGLFRRTVTSDIEITNTEGLLDRIGENLRKLDPSDPMVVAALRKYEAFRR